MTKPYWKNKKVLVTGAGGFIGSHLVEELAASGALVRAFVKYNSRSDYGNLELLDSKIMNRVEVVSGDIRDESFVRKSVAGMDVVFHLAALIGIPYSYAAPRSYLDVNAAGTLNVLQSALEYKTKKVVHTSTSEVYGTALYTPIDENHPYQAQSPYSASKIAADKLAESFHLSFSLPVTTVRPFNTFGERQSSRAVIPTIISQLLSQRDTIKMGSGTPVRDFLYVKDTARGFMAIAEHESTVGQVVNIGTGKGISISELVKLIMKLTGTTKKIVTEHQRIRPKNSEVMKLICSYKKANRLTGWKPQVTIDQGLINVINYIKNNLDKYKTGIYNV
jgi:NAD dependent epimerase/dehydratase